MTVKSTLLFAVNRHTGGLEIMLGKGCNGIDVNRHTGGLEITD